MLLVTLPSPASITLDGTGRLLESDTDIPPTLEQKPN